MIAGAYASTMGQGERESGSFSCGPGNLEQEAEGFWARARRLIPDELPEVIHPRRGSLPERVAFFTICQLLQFVDADSESLVSTASAVTRHSYGGWEETLDAARDLL